MPEDRRTDRTGDKADGVDGERLQHADQWVGFWKEQLPEDQTGDDAVEQEIVPFDRRADRAGDHGTPQLSGVLGFGNGAYGDIGCCHSVSSAVMITTLVWGRLADGYCGRLIGGCPSGLDLVVFF